MHRDILEIEISLDGDQWCALIGKDLQEGIAAFGDTPLEALHALLIELEFNPFNMNTFALS